MQNINIINVRLKFKRGDNIMKSLVQIAFICLTLVFSAGMYFSSLPEQISAISSLTPELLSVMYGAIAATIVLVIAMITLPNSFQFISLAFGYSDTLSCIFDNTDGVPFFLMSDHKITSKIVSWKEKRCCIMLDVNQMRKEGIANKLENALHYNADLQDTLSMACFRTCTNISEVTPSVNNELNTPLHRQIFERFSSSSKALLWKYCLGRQISYMVIRSMFILEVVKEG